ncbi:MAG: thermonuclease family protein [Myxococcales bacterium]|nr:thermonuclease family protein [Myxococcales bacterium]
MMVALLPLVLGAGLGGCIRGGSGDGGSDGDTPNMPVVDGGSSPMNTLDSVPNIDLTQGQPLEGNLALDDARMDLVDPTELPASSHACRAPLVVTVTRVVDGDTVWVSSDTEFFSKKVRLVGVDAPEVKHGDEGYDECYGDRAFEFTKQLEGHKAWLSFDQECKDKYDRYLAYLSVGPGEQDFWQRQLLRRGLANWLVVGANRAMASVLEQDEKIAEGGRRGLWADCN